MTRPLPLLAPGQQGTDLFWSGAARGELIYQVCNACCDVVFYPRRHCPFCGAEDLTSCVSSRHGTVYTFTVVRAHGEQFFRARAPYVVAMVDLDEAFRMIVEVRSSIEAVAIGSSVEVQWDTTQSIPIPFATCR